MVARAPSMSFERPSPVIRGSDRPTASAAVIDEATSFAILDQAVETARINPDLRIDEIAGHTDSRGARNGTTKANRNLRSQTCC